MQTIKKNITGNDYIEITEATVPLLLQFQDNGSIYVIESATQPVATDLGVRVMPNSRYLFLPTRGLKLWVRAVDKSVIVVLSNYHQFSGGGGGSGGTVDTSTLATEDTLKDILSNALEAKYPATATATAENVGYAVETI